jgi:hypothetical protein
MAPFKPGTGERRLTAKTETRNDAAGRLRGTLTRTDHSKKKRQDLFKSRRTPASNWGKSNRDQPQEKGMDQGVDMNTLKRAHRDERANLDTLIEDIAAESVEQQKFLTPRG